LEITEHIYDRAAGTRTAVLKLARGTVRALVGKVFGGSSKFEIHTDSAMAAARGTYFVVWMDADGRTGVANIGDAGDVAFLAGGQEVVVKPGQYSLTLSNRLPLPPAVIPQTGTARGAVRATELRENIAFETPQRTLQALGGVIERELPKPRLSVRPVVSGALTEEPQRSTSTSGSNSASPFPARATSGSASFAFTPGNGIGPSGITPGNSFGLNGVGNGIGPTGLAPGNGLGPLGAGLGTPNPNAALITPPAVISGGVPGNRGSNGHGKGPGR
jgi:hypothetical protein